ncbi:unnamed protein product [Heterobilharzia americana]|nr:unnamed protein product [Heterobilharzia americana]CAH8618700.1 unnamed protein product [Heterobilharzia americana]
MQQKLDIKSTLDKLPDGQIRYSTNKKWHAIMNFVPKPTDTPQYQNPVIALCCIVIVTYFSFVHERSELDDILDMNVEDFRQKKLKR